MQKRREDGLWVFPGCSDAVAASWPCLWSCWLTWARAKFSTEAEKEDKLKKVGLLWKWEVRLAITCFPEKKQSMPAVVRHSGKTESSAWESRNSNGFNSAFLRREPSQGIILP